MAGVAVKQITGGEHKSVQDMKNVQFSLKNECKLRYMN